MTIISDPKISVVILSYNFEKYIGECIHSVLSQTLRPHEIIICDDCSHDDSWKIIRGYEQRYPDLIKAHRQEQNLGPPRNANFGLKRVTGNLLCWMDGDDRWLPRKLEVEWNALKAHPDAQVAYSNVFLIDSDGRRTGIWHSEKDPKLPSGDVFAAVFSKRFFPHIPGVFRNHLRYKFTLDKIGYMDENLISHWDWDLKIRLAAKFRIIYSGDTLVEYRKHSGGFVSQTEAEVRFLGLVQTYEKNAYLLTERPAQEAVQTQCHIEEFLARIRARNRLKYLADQYSAAFVYARCCKLISQLPSAARTEVGISLSTTLRSLARLAAREEIEKRNWKAAGNYWIESLHREKKKR